MLQVCYISLIGLFNFNFKRKIRFCPFCGRLHGMQGYKASKVRGYKDGWTLEYGLRKRKWWWVKIHRWNVPIRMGCTHTGRLIGNLALQMNWELEACTKKMNPVVHFVTLCPMQLVHWAVAVHIIAQWQLSRCTKSPCIYCIVHK